MNTDQHKEAAYNLLKELIAIPSFSREEDKVAERLIRYFEKFGYKTRRKGNNLWIKSTEFKNKRPTVLLNSHIDTVKPSAQWTKDPYTPTEEDGKLYGLGSNDAGASLVSLIHVFFILDKVENRNFNLIMGISCEEEITGKNGAESMLKELGKIDVGIVGEPTQMQMAAAEKGLMVLDCIAKGKSGHAARNEGENAIYKAMADVDWFRTFSFEKRSELLGEIKMSVTQIEAGSQHNVVPDECRFVVDVRTNELYSNDETLEIITQHMGCEVHPRSTRLNSSHIPPDHPLVERGRKIGLRHYGSPTTSDQSVMPFHTLKIGPGDSARSHTADEYIYKNEIFEGIEIYLQLLENLEL